MIGRHIATDSGISLSQLVQLRGRLQQARVARCPQRRLLVAAQIILRPSRSSLVARIKRPRGQILPQVGQSAWPNAPRRKP